MREGLRTALARLDVLEKERAQGSGLANQHTAAATTTSDEGKRKADHLETRSSRRTARKAAKTTKYTDDSSDAENGNDSDFEIVQPPVENNHHHQQQPKVKLQRKTVTSYHGMKRKKLTELCSREGLPCNGSDDDLKKRHSEFITLYNSEWPA